MSKPQRKKYYKILLLGDSGVGKSSIMDRFVNNKFSTKFKSTIGSEFAKKEMVVDGKTYVIQLWDTAGQERFQSLGYMYYRGTDCCALVYDISNPESFEKLGQWRETFLKSACPIDPEQFPFILIGNKCDISDDQRKVQAIKAQQWCKNIANLATENVEADSKGLNLGANESEKVKFINRMKREGHNYSIPYFETSAKDGSKINEALREMLSLSIENENNTDLLQGMEGSVLDKNNMFDTKGVYLNKKNENISSKNNGGCSCYHS